MECFGAPEHTFACAEDPTRGKESFVPLSYFARASTVANLAQSMDAKFSQLNENLTQRFEDLAAFQAGDRTALQRGVASSLAMGNASLPSAPGRTSYDFNLATFRGETAVGGTLKHRLLSTEPVAISAGFSYAGKGSTAARVGVSGEF